MSLFIVETQKNIQHFMCQLSTRTSNCMLLYHVVVPIIYYPAGGRFLSKVPETFELVPLGCHNVSFQDL